MFFLKFGLKRDNKYDAEVKQLLNELCTSSFDFKSRIKIRNVIASKNEELALAMINALFDKANNCWDERILYDVLYGAVNTPYVSVAQLALKKFVERAAWSFVKDLIWETRFYTVAEKGLSLLISNKKYDLLRNIKVNLNSTAFEHIPKQKKDVLSRKIHRAIKNFVEKERRKMDSNILACFKKNKEKIMASVSELTKVGLVPKMDEKSLLRFITKWAHKQLELTPDYPDRIVKDLCSNPLRNFITPLIEDKFFSYDAECIYDVEEDFSKLIDLFLSHAQPELKGLTYKIIVKENQDESYNVTISFKYKGQKYSIKFKQIGDWEGGEVLRLFNTVLEDIGSPKRFADVSLYEDQCSNVIFATLPQINVLKKIYEEVIF